jgi:Cytochrome c554 and c-prime
MQRGSEGKVCNGKNRAFTVERALALCSILLLGAAAAGAQSMTGPNWNPVVGPPAGAKYVGEKFCATCHVEAAESYRKTAMSHAGRRAAQTQILRTHPILTFKLGPYRYRIVRHGAQSIYSVSDGKRTISAPILWAFGMPIAGQTYVLRRDSAYYQSRVSFYTDVNGLDITLGAPPAPPKTLEEAFGDRMVELDAYLCISCHTTGANVGGVFNPQKSVPGVTCEACHGPGANHVAAVQQGKPAKAAEAIFNPARLDPYDLDNFCGSCHRTWDEVEKMGIRDVRNVRFQPYRLQKSACWSASDARISCLACHDPHRGLVRKASFYDSKCLACHLKKASAKMSDHPGPACPVSTRNCITCHMPRYKLPGGHFIFFDHDIRVVEKGAPYPG